MGPTKNQRNRRQSKFPRKLRTRFGYGDDNERALRKSRHSEVKDAIRASLNRWTEESEEA